MKTLIVIAIAMLLAACSFSGTNPQPAAEGTTGDTAADIERGIAIGRGEDVEGVGDREGDAESEE